MVKQLFNINKFKKPFHCFVPSRVAVCSSLLNHDCPTLLSLHVLFTYSLFLFCSCIIGWQTIVGQPNRDACHVHGHTLSSAFNHSDCIWAVNKLANRDDTLLISSLLHSLHLNSALKLCCCHLFSLSRYLSDARSATNGITAHHLASFFHSGCLGFYLSG